MCVIGAFANKQQLRCMADKAVWLLSEGFERNIVKLNLIDYMDVPFDKASPV